MYFQLSNSQIFFFDLQIMLHHRGVFACIRHLHHSVSSLIISDLIRYYIIFLRFSGYVIEIWMSETAVCASLISHKL